MKWHILCSGKNKENISLSSAELDQRVVKVKAVVLVLFILCGSLWLIATGLFLCIDLFVVVVSFFFFLVGLVWHCGSSPRLG